jgi:hypothetical protein
LSTDRRWRDGIETGDEQQSKARGDAGSLISAA